MLQLGIKSRSEIGFLYFAEAFPGVCQMPFHWFDRDGQPLAERYAGGTIADRGILGIKPWSDLLHSIEGIDGLDPDLETGSDDERLISIFEEFFGRFLGVIDTEWSQNRSASVSSRQPVVFVSHQRADIAEAERIAELAWQRGIDYWLDIHDPVLKLATQTISPNDARYPLIIAAIIEMALLNSSHLIAVHTANSPASKWVPYELGRVRDRRIQSANAGGWFHPNLLPRQCGDYVHACKIARGGEVAVKAWLAGWGPGGSKSQSWPGRSTTQLPGK